MGDKSKKNSLRAWVINLVRNLPYGTRKGLVRHLLYARGIQSAFCIPTARANYGKLNIRFKGVVLIIL